MSKNGSLKPLDDTRALLAEAGFDLDAEMDQLEGQVNGNLLPRVRIEHRDNGRHRMYIDLGEGYFDAESELPLPGNELEGVVVASQGIRALWTEGETLPTCAAVEGIPTVTEPQAPKCSACHLSGIGSPCKPKMRLLILTEMDGALVPVVFALPPTSLKHWKAHLARLKRSGLPIVAVRTRFALEDTKKNGYRWAEVSLGVSGVPDRDTLLLARELRRQFEEYLTTVHPVDYSDPGDLAGEDDASQPGKPE